MVESLEETLRSQHNLDMLCSDRPLYTSEIAKVNDYYGFSSIIKKYAGLSILYPLKILVQHGIVFSDDFVFDYEKDSYMPSIFCYPPYREQAFKKNLSQKIIPSASPFIYLLEMIKTKKEVDRKGTIFFPKHSTTHVTIDMDYVGLAKKLKKLGDEYQPVTVCMYWKDYNLGYHIPFKENGLKIVSAGHKHDPCFLYRFYNLCSIHKYSSSNALGSHLFYSIKSGCTYFYLDGFGYKSIGKKEHIERFTPKLFSPGTDRQNSLISIFKYPQHQTSLKQMKLVDYYLGTKHLKSPQLLLNEINESEYLFYGACIHYIKTSINKILEKFSR